MGFLSLWRVDTSVHGSADLIRSTQEGFRGVPDEIRRSAAALVYRARQPVGATASRHAWVSGGLLLGLGRDR